MAKESPTTRKIAEISALGRAPLTNEVKTALHAALCNKNNLIVAAAVKVTRTHAINEFALDLTAAFDRFMVNPASTDKMCHAKLAILETLDEFGHDNPEIFLAAVSHVQHEPTYGGSVDTAMKLRVRAGQALSRIGHRSIFFILSDLLTDPQPEVRSGAARICATLAEERSELLLRMKVRDGDDKEENYGDYFTALLELSPQRSLSLVTGYINDPRQIVAEEAVVSLGQSRIPEAFAVLCGHFATLVKPDRRRVVIMAMGLLRSDEAAVFLINLVLTERPEMAVEAIGALRLYKDRPAIADQLKLAVDKRSGTQITAKFMDLFV